MQGREAKNVMGNAKKNWFGNAQGNDFQGQVKSPSDENSSQAKGTKLGIRPRGGRSWYIMGGYEHGEGEK